MCRTDYLNSGRTITIFTDHANLVYIYDPYGRKPGIPLHTESKFMRWSLNLSAFCYVVEHMPEEQNAWADVLTRWAVRPSASISNIKAALSVKSLMAASIAPTTDNTLDWTTLNDFEVAQSESSSSHEMISQNKIICNKTLNA